jgi:hypothetical protein
MDIDGDHDAPEPPSTQSAAKVVVGPEDDLNNATIGNQGDEASKTHVRPS